MSVGQSYKAAVIVDAGKRQDFDGLKYDDRKIPELGDYEVLVKMKAASLNYRDLMIARGQYRMPVAFPVVPASDGSGEVIAVGSRVRLYKKGSRVTTQFSQTHQAGAITTDDMQTTLGGSRDGAMRQYGVFPETGLVPIPDNLDYREGATLPCAALTAWNALFGLKPLKPGEWVLTEGTGGVSIFTVQFAKLVGAKVISTTSSKEKAEVLKKLGADHVVNYKEIPEWGAEVRKLTPDGIGISHAVEVGGPTTMNQVLQCMKPEGVITVIGFLGGFQGENPPGFLECLTKQVTVRGIMVGSRAMNCEMVTAIGANDLHPVLDQKRFGFDQVVEAYQYMWDQKHFGKVVIDIE